MILNLVLILYKDSATKQSISKFTIKLREKDLQFSIKNGDNHALSIIETNHFNKTTKYRNHSADSSLQKGIFTL